MLRIIDAGTGEPVDAAPARRGLTRVQAHVPGRDTTALRVLLVADVLVRALELGGTPVWALLGGERESAELRAGAAALGIRPFEDSRDVSAGPGEAQVIHVLAEDAGADSSPPPSGGVRLIVAPVAPVAPVAAGAAVVPEGVDPTVVRLALLSRRRSEPVRLDADALGEARETLVRWRRAVADWARRPSRAIPEEVRGELRTAWEDDLDVLGVLRVLREVETSELLEGARFETYAYADRLLGLELTRDLGSPA
ncbi:hypothetical protein [Streptomyces resistomycificus]|uniref:Cysteinyl-tRNA synthetase n=1 Tax=Streptomyces resistomycificus TaxID=67356 RepID=A0A0L8LKC3_9ACTN|nr:hypothetical protein [Streptomyces resistomycificus]KOG38673.1 cysteinyl-tRNA synthetase [Streptomyces resistomycificus]KUO00984.1 cysteinyl-tRNA synthetase [Streptomyces resistomycificus]